jgi:hypothetical protein
MVTCCHPNALANALQARRTRFCLLGVCQFARQASSGSVPMPGHADDDKDKHPGHEDNDKGILAKIAALEAQVGALQDEVKTLQGQLAAVQSNHALLLGPFVNVDPNPEIGVIGPNIIFSGANIHIISGSGSTDDHQFSGSSPTGLGNLIIGYDEEPFFPPGHGGGSPPPVSKTKAWRSWGVTQPGHRESASIYQARVRWPGLVAGEENTVAVAMH